MANDRYAGIALILVGGWFLLPLVSDVELPIRACPVRLGRGRALVRDV